MEPAPGGRAAGQPPGRPASPSGMSKLKASTRKLASKLGIGHHKKDRSGGVGTPASSGSPRAESPVSPASPAATSFVPIAGSALAPAGGPFSPRSPTAPPTPGLEVPSPATAASPLQAALPELAAVGGAESPRRLGPVEELESARERLARLRSVAERATHLEPGGGVSPLRAGFPQAAEWALQGGQRAHAGQAAAHLLGGPQPPATAVLPAATPAAVPAAEHAAPAGAQIVAGHPVPSSALIETAAQPAAAPKATAPAAGQWAAVPAPATAAAVAASPLERPKQQRRRVEAAALGMQGQPAGEVPAPLTELPAGVAATAAAASPLSPQLRTPTTAAAKAPAPSAGQAPEEAAPARAATLAAGRAPAAAPSSEAAPALEAAAAEEQEQEASEGLAAHRPVTADTRRGRLASAVAYASPYLGPSPGAVAGLAAGASPPAGPEAEAEQAEEAEETGATAPGRWQLAAQQPVAAVGGTTGSTHMGGPQELEAARLHRRWPPDAAGPSAEGAAEGEAAGWAAQQLPSPTDVLKGRGLAAADVAAGPHAPADAVAVVAGTVDRAPAAPAEKQPPRREEMQSGSQEGEEEPLGQLPQGQASNASTGLTLAPRPTDAAARAVPASPASLPSPAPSVLAALQAESAWLLEEEAELASPGQPSLPLAPFQQHGQPEGRAEPGPGGKIPAAATAHAAEEGGRSAPSQAPPSAGPPPGPAARVVAQREAPEPACGLLPPGPAHNEGPSLGRPQEAQELAAPLTRGTRRAPSEPLLPAGAFSRAQDISVFSPRRPEVYEVRDQEADLAAEVLPAGAGATVGPQTKLGVQLAPLAAGAEPERLDAGPFGAAEDISVFAPSGALPDEEEAPREAPEMDRSTEEEAVDVEELARRLAQEEHEKQLEEAADVSVSAAAGSAARQAAATTQQAGTAAKEAAGGAVASAAQAARVTVERVAAAAGAAASTVADAASRLSASATDQAAAASETATETAGAAADKAAAAKEAAAEMAGQLQETTVERAARAKEMAAEAAGSVADKAAGARDATVAAATGAAATAAEAAGEVAGTAMEKVATAKEAVATTAGEVAGSAAEKVAAAEEEAGAAATGSSGQEALGLPATAGPEGSGQAVDTARIAVETDEAARGKDRAAAAAPSVPAEIAAAEEGGGPAVEQAAEEAGREAIVPATGLAATLLGAATHAVHAVAEGLHSVLESGRQLAAEADAGSAERAAGGGSTAAPSEAGNGVEGGAVEEAGAGGGGPAVLPASPRVPQQCMQQAVAGDAAVSASLLPALEGAAEPAQLSAPALPSTARAVAAAPHRAAAVGGKAATVLPVAVGEADKRAVREAAARSPAVDASLAVEQEAPEVAEAELAEEAARARAAAATDSQGASTPSAGSRGPVLPVAVTAADRQASREAAARSSAVDASLAAEQEAPEVGEAELAAAKAAQPEGLDATPEYLAERSEARGQWGLGMGSRLAGSEEAEVAGSGSEQGPSGRLRMKDISGLGGGTSRMTQPAPTGIKGEASRLASEGTESEPWQEPGPSSGERERLLATQSSVGGLREPPPSPTTSSSPAASSPAAGGPGDVPRPSRLAVTASAWPGPTQEGGGTGATAEAKEAGSEAELREAAAAEGLEQAAEGVKAEAAKGLQAEAAEGVEASGEEVGGGGAAGQPAGLLGRASSGDKAGTAEKALDRIDTAGSSAGEAAGPERALLHLETGTSAGASDGGDVEDLPIPAAITPLGRARRMLQVAANWVHANPFLAAGGGVLLVSALWAVLVRLAAEVLGEFGPALAMAATIAVVGTVVAWLARFVRLPEGELQMVQEPALLAPPAGSRGAPAKEDPAAPAAAPAEAASPTLGEVEALPAVPGASASEPVGAESTEDLRGDGGGGGILQAARHAVVDAAEGAMEVVEPGREQVGEVIQETESGDEVAEGGDVLGSAVRAVTGVASAAAHKLGQLTDRAYQAMSREAPGADVSGEGAAVKSLAQAGEGKRPRLEPAPADPAPRPPVPAGGGEDPQSGYETDSEEPGPVLEGVHHAHYEATFLGGVKEPQSAALAGEQARAAIHHAAEGGGAQAAAEGTTSEPAAASEAPTGRLERAAEAASELAASAAGRVKHAAAMATGTAEEQRSPRQQLADLQESITAMEAERAKDVRFEEADKKLGL